MYCHNCGTEINDKAVLCVHCGVATNKSSEESSEQRIKDSGAYGIWGFILAILSLVLPVAYIDIVIGIGAFIISIIGVTGNKSKKGLAIAGIVVSIIAIIGALVLLVEEPEFYLF